uniref:Uncharacterized protein n=1 Tax=Parascaris equorum TaxID=6256 RepID=A0A914S2E9_PAREQ
MNRLKRDWKAIGRKANSANSANYLMSRKCSRGIALPRKSLSKDSFGKNQGTMRRRVSKRSS